MPVALDGEADARRLIDPASGFVDRGDRNVVKSVGDRRGTLAMNLNDLPEWLSAWCLDHLRGRPIEVLFATEQTSAVLSD